MIKPFNKPIYITRPILPTLKKYSHQLKKIWQSKWLTNFGEQHNILERELKEYLGVNNLSLFCNGTLALELGLQALNLRGEVITTPFTFPATITS
jgi:dTDP-4-amino-4,6-dideoxygalactose transaminase